MYIIAYRQAHRWYIDFHYSHSKHLAELQIIELV
jgi:hypothetical protein